MSSPFSHSAMPHEGVPGGGYFADCSSLNTEMYFFGEGLTMQSPVDAVRGFGVFQYGLECVECLLLLSLFHSTNSHEVQVRGH